MLEPAVVAIDLGNANTRLYGRGRGLLVDEPTVVTMTASSDRPVAVGHRAKAMVGRCHPGLRSIQPLHHGVVFDLAATQALLRELVRSTDVGRRMRVLVSVPVGTTPVERRGVVQAALSSGASEVTVIDEPLAAAIGLGLEIERPVGGMIVDVGAGVTEAVVVSLGGLVTSTSTRLAGDDMDQAIVDHVRMQHDTEIGLPTAERIKLAVGSVKGHADDRAVDVVGVHRPTGLPRRLAVASAEVAEAVEPIVAAIVRTVVSTLEATAPELCADIADIGMVLVGGTARLPGLIDRITSETGIPTTIASHPDRAVVRGSARCVEDRRVLRAVGL